MIIRMIVAGALVLAAGGLGIAFLASRPAPVVVVEAPGPEPVAAPAPAPAAKVAMLVAARPLAAGSLVKDEDFVVREVSPDAVARRRPGRVRGGAGRTARAPCSGATSTAAPSSPAATCSARDRGFLAAVLPPRLPRASRSGSMRSTGAAGLIWPGDQVDLILTQEMDAAAAPVSRRIVGETVLTDVRVIAVDQHFTQGASAGLMATGGNNQRSVARTVTLRGPAGAGGTGRRRGAPGQALAGGPVHGAVGGERAVRRRAHLRLRRRRFARTFAHGTCRRIANSCYSGRRISRGGNVPVIRAIPLACLAATLVAGEATGQSVGGASAPTESRSPCPRREPSRCRGHRCRRPAPSAASPTAPLPVAAGHERRPPDRPARPGVHRARRRSQGGAGPAGLADQHLPDGRRRGSHDGHRHRRGRDRHRRIRGYGPGRRPGRGPPQTAAPAAAPASSRPSASAIEAAIRQMTRGAGTVRVRSVPGGYVLTGTVGSPSPRRSAPRPSPAASCPRT